MFRYVKWCFAYFFACWLRAWFLQAENILEYKRYKNIWANFILKFVEYLAISFSLYHSSALFASILVVGIVLLILVVSLQALKHLSASHRAWK